MNRTRFDELIRRAGNIAPEGIERYCPQIEPRAGGPLFDHALLERVIEEYSVPQEKAQMLREALAAIEQDAALLELSQYLSEAMHRAHNENIGCEYEDAPKPDCLSGFAREAYAFLFALACMEQGRRQLRERGVPEQYDADIPERMIRKQMRRFIKTGKIGFDDFPWDIGFYACSIFFLDRFYFIPYRHSIPEAWRNRKTGKVIALWPGDVRVRRDGQIDGVNGITDSEAFVTRYCETEGEVTGNPVDPRGRIMADAAILDKAEWERALGKEDYLLALHIPGGEGYTPERVRSSCIAALEFYGRYFPELPIKGFWSESWLYDPGLEALLPPESRILQVQRQFYCYPTEEGEEMVKWEVFGTDEFDPASFECRTSLQKNLCAAWLSGCHFHTTGMFLLRDEVENVGTQPYLA